jgi:hypothetical protein
MSTVKITDILAENLKVEIWCVIHAHRINEPMFLHKTKDSECYEYARLILSPFFDQLPDEEKA